MPKCPQRGTLGSGPARMARSSRMSTRPPYSSIFMELPPFAQEGGLISQEDSGGAWGLSPSATLDLFGQLAVADAEGAVVLDTGATDNLVCF